MLSVDRSHTRHYGDAQGRYWSVSQVVDVVAPGRGYADAQAMQRGTDVHRIFELRMGQLLGACEGPDVPPEYDGYDVAIQAWITQAKPQPMMLECLLRHHTLPYAGRLDFVGWIGHEFGVLDLKTGSLEKWHRLQLHGYQQMVDKKAKMWVLCIGEGGTYKVVPITYSARDWAAFQNGLSILHWRESS